MALPCEDTQFHPERPYWMACKGCMAKIPTLILGCQMAEATLAEYQKLNRSKLWHSLQSIQLFLTSGLETFNQ